MKTTTQRYVIRTLNVDGSSDHRGFGSYESARKLSLSILGEEKTVAYVDLYREMGDAEFLVGAFKRNGSAVRFSRC